MSVLGSDALGRQVLGQLSGGATTVGLTASTQIFVKARVGLNISSPTSAKVRVKAFGAMTIVAAPSSLSATAWASVGVRGAMTLVAFVPPVAGDPELIYAGFEDRGAKVPFEDRNMIVPPTEDLI